MTPDYYATLGVAPTSEDVVIRAAYLALMRRYHPDRNPSAQAEARARAITAAYAVLGDWDRRAEYDLMRARHRAEEAMANAPRTWPRPSPTGLFAAAAMVLLVAILVFGPPLPAPQQPNGVPRDQIIQAAAAGADPATHCSSPATNDLLKRELFRRAARLRGSDQAAIEKMAGGSLIRIDSPQMIGQDERRGTIRCTAGIAIDLPPGVAVVGGRRNLIADIGFSLKGVGNSRRQSISLFKDRAIVVPLATLAQIPPPEVEAPDLADVPHLAAVAVRPQLERPRPAPVRAAAPPPPRARVATQRPIAQAKPSSQNADLAALDRHLAMLYGQSWGQSDAAKRAQLVSTRDTFLARRDACRSDSCVSQAYLGRMREISDIMAKPQPPR